MTTPSDQRRPMKGDRVRVTFGAPHPGWMDGEVLQSNPRKHRAVVRWDADRMTDLVAWDRITVLRALPLPDLGAGDEEESDDPADQ